MICGRARSRLLIPCALTLLKIQSIAVDFSPDDSLSRNQLLWGRCNPLFRASELACLLLRKVQRRLQLVQEKRNWEEILLATPETV